MGATLSRQKEFRVFRKRLPEGPCFAEHVEEWKCEWSNEALSKRLAAYVQPYQYYKDSLRLDRSAQRILSSIPNMVIPNFDELTFASTCGDDQEAFRVRDFGSGGAVCSAQIFDQLEKSHFLDRLKKPRSTKYSHGREIEVLEFTPSAVTAVLMSSAKPIYGGPSSFDVMLKHLSTEGSFDHLSKSIESSNSFFCISIPFCAIDCGLEKIGPPTMNPTRSINVQKFSMSLHRFDNRVRSPDLPLSEQGPWLLVIYGAPARRRLQYEDDQVLLVDWITICLMMIRDSWISVLEEMDKQAFLKGIMKVQPENENFIIFYDEHPYRWALQTFSLFLDMIDRTTKIIEEHLGRIPDLTGEDPYLPKGWQAKVCGEAIYEFETLSDGIKQRISVFQKRVAKLPPPNVEEACEPGSMIDLINSKKLTTASVSILPLIIIMIIILDGEFLAGKFEFISFFITFTIIGTAAIMFLHHSLFEDFSMYRGLR